MKINNPFKTLALLMAMLIFGTPVVTFAQQNTAMLEAKAAASGIILPGISNLTGLEHATNLTRFRTRGTNSA